MRKRNIGGDLKIVLVVSSYLPALGGLQEAVSQLASEFRAQGHEVTVITNRYPTSLGKKEVIGEIPVRRMLFSGFYLSSLEPKRIVKYAAGLLIGLANMARLLNMLRRIKPDVVNIHFLGSQAPYAMLASKMLGIRCVVSLHGDDVEGLPYRSKIDNWLFRKVVSGADHVTACSKYLLNEATQLAPGIEGKAAAIHNGIRPEEFNNILPYQHERPYIFAGGRFVQKKGFDVLLKAYSIAVEKGLQADLILAGEGHEKKRLFALAFDLGLSIQEKEKGREWSNGKNGTSGKIIFWGRADSPEMKSLMGSSELVVIPSRKEPFGILALEALAAGKKVVGVRVGGLPEILAGIEDARMVTPEDAEGLAEGILLSLSAKKEKAVADLWSRSWQAAAMKYLDVFKTTLK